MNEKNHTNQFRFNLYQEDVLLCEKIFSADSFNPLTRYSIDIRDLLPQAITRIQRVLSQRNYDTLEDVGDQHYYDLLNHNRKVISLYPKEYHKDMYYNPKPKKQHIEDMNMVIKGVECKIGLYINDNPIVERVFYVDGFNSVARYSPEVVHTVVQIVESIIDNIKKVDIKNMWDDYDLINKRGLSINQIRELHPNKRASLLEHI